MPILPLVIDIEYPSPGFGLDNEVFAPAIQRLKCDMVLALDLVHLLVFKQYYPFEMISKALSTFSRRWLVVEYISPKDVRVRNWSSDQYFSWYTLENFIKALNDQFHTVTVNASDRDTNFLILCEK